MIHSILAQAGAPSTGWSSSLEVWGVLALLAVNLVTLYKSMSGQDSERQIEPTQLAAITSDLKTVSSILSKLDREAGETKSAMEGIARGLIELRANHHGDILGVHTRVNIISADLAGTKARVEVIEKRIEEKN